MNKLIYIEFDHLKSDYDLALSIIEQQRKDIKRFLLLLIEKDIPIPEDLINRYINKSLIPKPSKEELPFD